MQLYPAAASSAPAWPVPQPASRMAGVLREAEGGEGGHGVGRRHIAVGVDQVGIIAFRPVGVEVHQPVGGRVGIGDGDVDFAGRARRVLGPA